MENNYQNDDIEQLLRDQLRDQKMYPSEHVWENIRTEIHGNTSWPALTFIAIFIIIALTISTIYNYPPQKIIASTSDKTLVQKQTDGQLSPAIGRDIDKVGTTADTDETLQTQMDPNNYTAKTFASINKETNNITTNKSTQNTSQSLIANESLSISSNSTIEPGKQINVKPVLLINKANYTTSKVTITDNYSTSTLAENDPVFSTTIPPANVQANSIGLKIALRNKNKNKKDLLFAATNLNYSDENPNADTYLKDFGFEALKNKRQKSRWEMQFYLTPSISYRKLEDDKERLNYLPVRPIITGINAISAPLAPNNSTNNINSSVHHTPALGMEVGLGLLYNITPTFKLKTGLQFNIRQYYIDASQSLGIATIAFVQNNHLDSVNIFSTLSNSTNGFNNTKIDTKLYQVSIPLGLQWDFIQGKKLGISIGASIQPTFTLNKNVYMISTDYKYYANGAPFFRKWNLNTSVDLNVSYKTGDLKWYIGPQIRYQHLPTYNDIYPIKEYRWDYGLKIGLSIPIYK